ncbi:Uncharacterised protein [uncultured Ruminococcus sp.]|nr:hypothetical protein [uncultured Ruminococcus sp.]SCJ61162.1 Uncharacterised protein [uncultured Ruminococcus sp.]
MKLKERMQNSFFALSDNRLLGRKKLAISYVSLFLVFTLVLVTTVAWFTVKDTASINSQAFSLESSAALRVNDGQEDLSNHLVVKGFKLEEASSVDGRNMFFPSEGNFKDSTSAMKFREGTAGDRNKTYVYKDFKLNADSDMTNVYIKGYNITIVSADGKTVLGKFDGSTEIIRDDKGVPVDQKVYDPCPLRLAFITDSSKTPTVIDPSALIDEHAKNYNAVSSTNMVGSPATKLSSCKTFSDFYFYSGESLFTLLGQKPLDVTLVAWFEGAYEDQSVYDKYAGASVTIDVELESNYNDMEAITFIDKTRGDKGENTPWIKTDDCIVTMQYKDTDATQKTVVMKYLGSVDGYNTWTAALPKDVTTDISFFRFSTTNNIIYNSWHTKDNVNNELSPTAQGWIVNNEDLYPLQESRIVNGNRSIVYTAKRGNGFGKTDNTAQRLSPCIGYWDYSPSGSTVETTAPSPTTPTSGGGSSEDPEVNTGVYLNIPDTKQWLRNYLTSGAYEPYVIYNYNGVKSDHLMQFESDGSRCTLDNCSAPRGSRVIGFKFVNKKGTHTQLIPAKNEYIFSTPFNVSYEVNNDDTATYR